MIVLAARPSMGKTSLAMNIAECVALGKDIYGRPMKGDHCRPHPVAVFSLEMSTESLSMRMLCGFAGVPASRSTRGSSTPRRSTSSSPAPPPTSPRRPSTSTTPAVSTSWTCAAAPPPQEAL